MARRTASLLVALVGYYVFVLSSRAVTLLGDDRWAFRGLGAGLVLLALVGVAVVAADVRFGFATQRLGRLAGDLGDPADFDAVAARAEAAPEDWRSWYALALAYDAGRDPRRGRAAMRRAIALERATR